MAWVTAYCLGPFGGNERTWKPFNPILGETFELDKEGGVRFLAEQVEFTSHFWEEGSQIAWKLMAKTSIILCIKPKVISSLFKIVLL